jgi:hypothetical protein
VRPEEKGQHERGGGQQHNNYPGAAGSVDSCPFFFHVVVLFRPGN